MSHLSAPMHVYSCECFPGYAPLVRHRRKNASETLVVNLHVLLVNLHVLVVKLYVLVVNLHV